MPAMTERLIEGAAALGVPLDAGQAQRLLGLLSELARWNRSYNLTAVTEPEAMLTHHLLDSLAVHPFLPGNAPGEPEGAGGAGERTVVDVGTGAGFPGLPLALVNPTMRFTLVDSNGKKIRFVSHAAHDMGLSNVEAVQARAEQMRPAAPFGAVVARAYAALPLLLTQVEGLCSRQTRVLAMKGKRPDEELAALPAGWRVEGLHALTVPGLAAERTLVVLRQV